MGDIHNESKGPVYGPSIQAGRIGQINITVAPTTALAGLPPGDGEFVGRQSELALLAAVLCPDTGDSRPLAVSAIAGLPGVGKTALAVKAARNAVNAGWFPRGVLFLDLEGYA
ncbi:ATP-binding protein, partial [Streptomyces sp. MCAF7]